MGGSWHSIHEPLQIIVEAKTSADHLHNNEEEGREAVVDIWGFESFTVDICLRPQHRCEKHLQ